MAASRGLWVGLLLVVTCLWIGYASGQEYTPVNLGNTVTKIDLMPCSRAYYTFDAMPGATVEDYIQIEWTSTNSLVLIVSDVELFSDVPPTYEYTVGGFDDSLVISCPITKVEQWYLTVDNPSINGTPSNVTITFLSGTVTVQNLEVDQSYDYVEQTFTSPDFATMYDFFSFDFSGTTNQFSDVEISVTSAQSGMSIILSLNTIPDSTAGSNCVFVSGTNSIRINSCEFAAIYEQNPSATWYMAVRPVNGDDTIDYTVEIAVSTPTIATITINEADGVQYTLTRNDDVAYFSFSSDTDSESEEYLSVIVANVRGGTIDVDYSYDQVALACAGIGVGSCTTDDYCEQVIDYCNLESGTTYYYVTVSAFVFDNPPSGDYAEISFTIAANVTEIPDDSDLDQGELAPGSLSNGYYDLYKVKDNGFDSNDNTLLNVHLYVDQTDGELPILFVNPEQPGGSESSCEPAFASCQVLSSGSCTVQISPCSYNEYDDWYVSVGSGSDDFYGSPISYTIAAELVNPYEFETDYLAFSGVVFEGTYSHFEFNSDLLPRGGAVTAFISDISGGELGVFVNRDGLAGVPCCYDFTQSDVAASGGSLDITVRNCNDDSDFYLSIYGSSADDEEDAISYTITVVAYDGPLEPEEELPMGSVQVGTIDEAFPTNYTLSVDSDEILVIKVRTVETVDPAPMLTMTLYNSTYLNCLDSQYAFVASCSTDSLSTCSIVVEPCVLDELEDLILVIDSNGQGGTFNVEASQYSADPIKLDNGVAVAGYVQEGEYAQYSYEADGDDTLIFEVYFDTCLDVFGNQAVGDVYLNYHVDTNDDDDDDDDDDDVLPAGRLPCYDSVQTCSSLEKCAFALSSCSLKEGMFYISVQTTSSLKAQSPLGYTLTATEKDDVVPVTLGLQEYYQLYDDQIIYNTFDVNISPSEGSVVLLQLSNVEYVQGGAGSVSAQVSQTVPPSQEDETCPCFDYEWALTSDVALSIDYCQQVGASWTIRVTPTGPFAGGETRYGLTVTEFTQTPAVLNIGAVSPGTVYPYLYQYYKLNETLSADSSVVVSVTNISGGLLSVYVASENPATSNCNDGTLCAAEDTGCTAQLSCAFLAADAFQYVSVLGLARNTSADNAITFDIQVTTQAQPTLSIGAPLNGQELPGTYSITYAVDLTSIQQDRNPLVTFSVSNINADSGAISFTMSLQDLPCGDTIDTNLCNGEDDCDWEVPGCLLDITSGTAYFTVKSTSPGIDMTYSVSASAQDIGANAITVGIGDFSVADANVGGGQWKTFAVAADPSQYNEPSDLTIEVTSGGSFVAYESFGVYPGPPPCYENTLPLTVSSCCVQTGTYYVAVQNLEATTETITVTASLTQIAYETTNLGSIDLGTSVAYNQDLLSYPPNVLLPFSFTLSETADFAAFYVLTSSNVTFSAFVEQVSPAGPSDSSLCFTNNFGDESACSTWFDGGEQYTLCMFPQCAFPLYYDVGPFQASLLPTMATTQDISASLTAAYIGFTNLATVSTTQTLEPRMTAYYTLTIQPASQTAQGLVTISATAGNNFVMTLFPARETVCGGQTTQYSCAGSQCTINYPTCEGVGDFYVVVENQSTDTLDLDLSYANGAAFNPLELPTLNEPNIMPYSSGLDYVSVDVPALNATQWATFYVGDSNSTTVSVRWTYGNTGPYCFTGNDDCAPSSPAAECAIVFYDCNLIEGSYIFEISADFGSTYTYGFNIFSEPVNTMTLEAPVRGEVPVNGVEYYQVSIDRSHVLPGQSITFSVAVECGTVDLYVGEGAIAGGSCGAPAATQTISSCDLLTSAVAPVDTIFYLTVVGTSATFEQYDVPVRYQLFATVTGAAHTFVPIGVQQPVLKNPDPTTPANNVYVYAVPGVGEFSGQLVIEAYMPELTGISASPLFFVGFDVVPGTDFCPFEPSIPCVTSLDQLVCSLVLDSCDLAGVRFLYIQWYDVAVASTILQVSQMQGFVRDLDLYDYYPQQGAVSSGAGSFDQPITDEEYYRLSLDTTPYNFHLTADLVAGDDTARLMASIDVVPSSCGYEYASVATRFEPAQLVWGYCEIAEDDTEMYFAVDTTDNSLSSYDVVLYNLTVSRTIETINITSGYDACYTIEPNGVIYFGFEGSGHYTAGSAIEVTVHGVGSSVDVYIDGNGLATERCSSIFETVGPDGAETISYPCPYTKEVVTAAVYNNDNQPVSFYLSWDFEQTDVSAISVNGAAVEGSESTYYSFAFPSLTGEEQLIFNVVGAVEDVYYAANQLPRGDCPLYLSSQCTAKGCAFTLSQCLYATTDTIYVYVVATGDYTATLFTRDNYVADLDFGVVYTGSFPQPSQPADFVPVVQSFTIDVDQSDIDEGPFPEMEISIFGVNQAIMTAVVARDEGTIPGTECTYVHASSFSESTVISIPSCYLTDANYYLGIYLEIGGPMTTCADFTFGILVTFTSFGAGASAPTALTLSTSLEVPYLDPTELSTIQYFQVSPAASATQVVEIQTVSSNPAVQLSAEIMFNNGVGMCASGINTPVEYVKCNIPDTFYLAVGAALTGSPQDVKPGSSYSIMVSTKSISALSSGNTASGAFEMTAGEVTAVSEFYSFEFDDTQSFSITINVLSGPSVEVQLLYSDCVTENGGDVCECPTSTYEPVTAAFTCYYGKCQVPISWLPSELPSATYNLQLTGYAPATFEVTFEAGEEGNCQVPETSEFCDIDYSVWNYGTGTSGEDSQNEAAEELYHVFANLLTLTSCVDLSSSCNDSLVQYVCGLTYPACDESGFQTSTCRASCEQVQEDCGFTFESIGLAYLSCDHNAYLLDDDSICTDIYDVVDDGLATGWKIFLIVLAVLVAIVILALLVVLVAALGKKAYDSRLSGGYDVIDESPNAYGADEDAFGQPDEESSVVSDNVADYGAVEASAPPSSPPPAPPVPPEE